MQFNGNLHKNLHTPYITNVFTHINNKLSFLGIKINSGSLCHCLDSLVLMSKDLVMNMKATVLSIAPKLLTDMSPY